MTLRTASRPCAGTVSVCALAVLVACASTVLSPVPERFTEVRAGTGERRPVAISDLEQQRIFAEFRHCTWRAGDEAEIEGRVPESVYEIVGSSDEDVVTIYGTSSLFYTAEAEFCTMASAPMSIMHFIAREASGQPRP